MIPALLSLITFQLAGEMLAEALGLPVPGMILGMLLLFVALCLRRPRGPAEAVEPIEGSGLSALTRTLHAHLGLFLIPAGTGVLAHLPLLRQEGPAILAILLLSTLLTVLVMAAGAALLRARSKTALGSAEFGR
jgi:putative effector of murein hydrolase LrgA (UPF0299 family)